MREIQASAPGRVNLIGEHTDYHDGYVMPCAMPQRARVVLRPRKDRHVFASSNQMGPGAIEFAVGQERRQSDWVDYVQGVTWILRQEGFELHGFDLHVDSEVPLGSGLSSSAALEVATLRALREAFELQISDVLLAQLAQRAEVEFVGAPVGILDQMAASLADDHTALFLDTRYLTFERIPLPETLELVIINSGVAHQHAGGQYRIRRRESEEAAEALGVDRLRDVEPARLSSLARLPALLAKRARHVVTENARVLEARAALLAGDLAAFGGLLSASQASLRDDYEVSVPPVDLLVSLAESHAGVFGARMTGGGFGGAVVIAATAGQGATIARQISEQYASQSGLNAEILLPVEVGP